MSSLTMQEWEHLQFLEAQHQAEEEAAEALQYQAAEEAEHALSSSTAAPAALQFPNGAR